MSNETLKKLLCELLCENQSKTPTEVKQAQSQEIDAGIQIVVLTCGFIYAGQTSIKGNFLYITNASNIRRWGTTKGLGELIDGPLPETKHDVNGNVQAPLTSVIHLIKCNKGW